MTQQIVLPITPQKGFLISLFNTWLQAIDWDATKSLWTLLNDLGSVKATKWNMKCRRQRRRKLWENKNFYLQTLSPHPLPFRPSLITISQKFGGSCLISSKKKRCRLKLHLSFTAICVWHLLRVATIVGQLLRPVLRAISAHLAGGAREKCTSPTVTAWRTKVFSLFQYFLDFLANSLALVSLWGCVLTVTVHSRNYSR